VILSQKSVKNLCSTEKTRLLLGGGVGFFPSGVNPELWCFVSKRIDHKPFRVFFIKSFTGDVLVCLAVGGCLLRAEVVSTWVRSRRKCL
jgi:hypothetical protein